MKPIRYVDVFDEGQTSTRRVRRIGKPSGPLQRLQEPRRLASDSLAARAVAERGRNAPVDSQESLRGLVNVASRLPLWPYKETSLLS